MADKSKVVVDLNVDLNPTKRKRLSNLPISIWAAP